MSLSEKERIAIENALQCSVTKRKLKRLRLTGERYFIKVRRHKVYYEVFNIDGVLYIIPEGGILNANYTRRAVLG